MSRAHAATQSPFRQPKAVWAVAFACVISFMGIGLVDPILPALASELHATPSQVELLFTSYLVVTSVAMLVTNAVSSRIGPKATLVGGLALIVVSSALAGSSNSIGGIVGFRAGWGLGNALFIATSLAVIVASARGGFGGAIILYETALGIGIAIGPLLGGELGAISWRGPFYGVALLMAIALAATATLVPRMPRPERPTSVLDPIRALRHRGLLTISVTALCYNWGFFTLLAYTPFPMHLGIHQLGYVFTAWGVMVGIFAVFAAPRLQQRFGTVTTLYVNFLMMAADLVAVALGTSSQITLIVAVIVAGAFIGINNTLVTQAVMQVAPVPRPVASAAYGFVRFIGGGLAPYFAGRMAESFNVGVPFFVGAGTLVLATAVLATGHRVITEAEREELEEPAPPPPGAPVIAAVGPGERAVPVRRAAANLAALIGCPVEVLHVRETEILPEDAIDSSTAAEAEAAVAAHVARLQETGIPAWGTVLRVTGSHGEVGARIAAHARSVGARAIVVGTPTHGGLAGLLDASATERLWRDAPCHVVLVKPDAPVHDLTGQVSSGRLRGS